MGGSFCLRWPLLSSIPPRIRELSNPAAGNAQSTQVSRYKWSKAVMQKPDFSAIWSRNGRPLNLPDGDKFANKNSMRCVVVDFVRKLSGGPLQNGQGGKGSGRRGEAKRRRKSS
jgi:hypothetical protein